MLRHWISLWFVLALTLVSANLFAPASASAEPAITASCYGASCNGLDPDAAGCTSGAYVVAYGFGYSVARYYSPSCNAFYSGASVGATSAWVTVWMEDNFNATYSSRYPAAVSKMWESGRACVYHEPFGGVYCA